jgi:gamma-glutamyltranspeptidase/glutathione hydrolase
MGYAVDVKDGHWSEGECIEVDRKTSALLGGLDHRSHYGKAAGY